jgi:hypothetical protein
MGQGHGAEIEHGHFRSSVLVLEMSDDPGGKLAADRMGPGGGAVDMQDFHWDFSGNK